MRYYLGLIEMYNRLNESAKSHADYRATIRAVKKMIQREHTDNISK